MTVMSNDFSAEYAGIANIRITTKRGTANYHGSLFYENKNSALAAWSLQDKDGQATFAPSTLQSSYPTPYFNVNVMGATVRRSCTAGPRTPGSSPRMKGTGPRSRCNFSSNTLPHPSSGRAISPDWMPAKPHVPASVTLTAAEVAQNTVGGLGLQFIRIPSRLLNPTVQKLIGKYFPPIGFPRRSTRNGRIPGFRPSSRRIAPPTLAPAGRSRFPSNDRVYLVYNGSGPEQCRRQWCRARIRVWA